MSEYGSIVFRTGGESTPEELRKQNRDSFLNMAVYLLFFGPAIMLFLLLCLYTWVILFQVVSSLFGV